MTRAEAKEKVTRHWGTALAGASAVLYYAMSAYGGHVPDEAKATAIMAGVFGIAKWLKEANKTDTDKSVAGASYDTLLAELRIARRFDKLEETQESNHKENSAKLKAIAVQSAEDDRLHAEHRAVTDSHADAIGALNTAVQVVVPTFQPPPLVGREDRRVG